MAPGSGPVKIAAAIAIAAAGLGGGIAYKKFREYLREKKLRQQRGGWQQKHSIPAKAFSERGVVCHAWNPHKRTIWIADAHRDGKRFVVHADEKLRAIRTQHPR